MRSKQDAAAARAAAAQRDEARSRLSGLDVERQGYVARGDEDGVAAVDDEISKYKAIAGVVDDDEPVDLAGLDPAEVFRMFGVPDDVVEAFAADLAAKTADPDKSAGDRVPADQTPAGTTDADKSAEPTAGRRGRARTAAQPDDAPAADTATAPAGD